MWKIYSKSYLKKNRASSLSILASILVASMFLSLLCSTAYNFWIYETEKIILEEGDWQGRIICDQFHADDASVIQQFANVEKAVINEALSRLDNAIPRNTPVNQESNLSHRAASTGHEDLQS